jgi:uncharacterized BrkB/YihY/UPF0761 family membrane protein
MRLSNVSAAVKEMVYDVDRNHTLQMAAALSYYFVIAVFHCLDLPLRCHLMDSRHESL